MNGVHDMGGLQCFGPVRPEPDEPLFHAPWESRALAVTLAMGAGGRWNIDLSRAARESLPPATYLASSYYEIWIRALEQLMLERGLVSAAELAGDATPAPAPADWRPLAAERVDAALAAGSPTERPAAQPARFTVGDRVRAAQRNPAGHTRLPRYVRGQVGTVAHVHGAHIFPDRHVSRPLPPYDDVPEWLYTVVFDGRTLWGAQADPTLEVSVDAWEPYLEPA